MTNQRKLLLRRKLQEARLRMLARDVDIAEPLLDMVYVATNDVRRISTNGNCIFFDASWLCKLSDYALDFALGHQLMHIQLGHLERSMLFQGDRYHLACDIVANANLIPYGLAADTIPGLGKIFTETFFPKVDGRTVNADEAFDMVPFDPAILKKGQRDRYIIDDEFWWGKIADPSNVGIIILCPDDPDPEDLICNVEYGQLVRKHREPFKMKKRNPIEIDDEESDSNETSDREDNSPEPNWDKMNMESIQSLRFIKEQSTTLAETEVHGVRLWHPLKDSKLSWREILNTFLQEVIQDYSFTPPDKRYSDSVFFLPDYNDIPIESKDVLFYVDTSGSVDDITLSRVSSEICGAIEQFQGYLDGMLVFFDTITYPEITFKTAYDISCSIPTGGGGTDFCCVFRHAAKAHTRKPISSIVIFTDGEGSYPHSWELNVPVLWIINNKFNTPPFGTVARI